MTATLVGIDHVALEVGDIDQALDWYGQIFAFRLRGRAGRSMAFIDMGDQFIALSAPRAQPRADDRHFGLVVDDKEAVRRVLEQAGAEIVATRGLRFVDPWGNNVEVVQYDEVQFSKTQAVLAGMGLPEVEKTEAAQAELRDKGLAGQETTRMSIRHVLAVVAVADFEAAHAWYKRLFGRPADNLPMEGQLVEWRVTDCGWVQVTRDADRAGSGLLNFAVDDLHQHVAEVSQRGLAPGPIETVNKGVQLSALRDPDGNTITFIGSFRVEY